MPSSQPSVGFLKEYIETYVRDVIELIDLMTDITDILQMYTHVKFVSIFAHYYS